MKFIFKTSLSLKLVFWLCFVLSCLSCSEEDYKINPGQENSEAKVLNREVDKGRHIFEDGSVYEGELVRGRPNGFGNRKFQNGDHYEGQFQDGFAHGHGTMRYKSDDNLEKYVRMWASSSREGCGTLYFSDSSQMIGNWKNDSLSYGEFQGMDGSVFSGKWEGESLAEGRMRDEFGNEFTGFFTEKGMYFQGNLKVANGDEYTGYFVENL